MNSGQNDDAKAYKDESEMGEFMRLLENNRKIPLLILILLSLFLSACKAPRQADTADDLLFQRIGSLCRSLNEEGFGGDVVTITENREWVYTQGEIEVSIFNNDQRSSTDYVVSINEETVLNYTREYVDRPSEIFVYYADVNADGYKDIALTGEAPGGTLSGPNWAYVHDLHNDCELKILDGEGALTDGMIAEIENLLDERFYRLFPAVDLAHCKYTGELYVDCRGNLYYITSLAEGDTLEKIHDVGEMIVFLAYDTDRKLFFVEDILYGPIR